jgi:hypothetical protein
LVPISSSSAADIFCGADLKIVGHYMDLINRYALEFKENLIFELSNLRRKKTPSK